RAQSHLSRQADGGGGFLEWMERELPHVSRSAAYRYLGIHKFVSRHGGEFPALGNSIDLSAILLIAQPSTPGVHPAPERALAREKVTQRDVKDIIANHEQTAKPTPPPPPPQAALKANPENSKVPHFAGTGTNGAS